MIRACPDGQVVVGVATANARLPAEACEKVAIELGLGRIISGYSSFLVRLKLA